MKKGLHLLFACAAFASGLSAQTFITSTNPVSANSEGRAQYDVSDKSMIRFNTDITTPQQQQQANQDRLNYLNTVNPNYEYERNAYEASIQQFLNKHNSITSQMVVTIPVVVHVVYNTAAQNISNNQVFSQIQVLNEDFGRTNSDVNTHWSQAANTTIQFCLAQQDPSGNVSNGITRTSTSTTSFSSNDNVKHAASGGADAWDPTRYLNIWVCNLGGGLLGYGEFPTASVSQTFGVVILYSAFGSNFTSYGTFATVAAPYDEGRTTTHEFSHCFNLYHIWGDDNGACTGSDLCADTPNQADATTTCYTFPHTDGCTTTNPGIMFENYMDYSYDNCMNLFTQNQKSRMLAVLATAPYNALTTSTGCSIPANSPPTAMFSASATTVCPSTAITFTNLSSANATGWTWTFPSGTPSSSTAQNPPSVTWTTPGTYTVSLVASNTNGTSTYTMAITILGSVSPPLVEGFEATTFPPTNWTNYDAGANGMVWGRYNAGHNSSYSAQFDNFNNNVNGTRDELRTPKLNLSAAATVTMTFDVAYKRYNTTTTYYDSLEVAVSTDCGATWTSVYLKGGTTLQTVTTTQTTIFVPANTNWRTETVSLNTYAGNPGVMIAFRNRGHYGQPIYVDNVNITTTAAAPSATFTASATTVCAGTPVAFTDASSGSPTSWTWTFPSGTPASATTQNVASVVWNTAGTYTVTHTATNGSGTGTSTQVITVNALPTITTTTTSATICSGNSTTITASGGTTYSWMPGSLTGTTVTVSPTATTTYTVTGTNANGCVNTATRTITVNPSPTVTTTTTNAIICSGSSTTITASGATTYSWMPGSLTGTTVTISPAATTTYTVTGTSGGCTGTATRTITVNPTPTVTTTTTGATICNGSSTTITASGATTYSWMPGSLTGATVTVSPTTTTTYTVTGTNSGCTGTATRTITVNPTPTVTTTTTGGTICSGNSTTITASGATSYAWMPGSLTGTTVTVSPAATTTYTVTGTGANGCTGTATRTITVNPTPTVTATASSPSVCTGNPVTLSASGATTYNWQPGNHNGQPWTTTPASTTTYTVTGTTSGCTGTATVTVSVGAPPTVTASASSNSICTGSNSTLTAVGAATYTWMPGSLSGTSVTVNPTASTTYTVTGSSGPGCTGTATVAITVNPLPAISASASNTTICDGNSTTLSASGGTSYNWMPGSLSGASVSVSPNVTTTFTVTGTDANGCSNTATQPVTVNPAPNVSATATNTTLCAGNNTTLTAAGASTYNWQPGSFTGTTITDAPASSITYTVTGTDISGCTGTATVGVTVNANPSVTGAASNPSVCAGSSVTLFAGGASTYDWQPVNQSGSTITDIPAATITYTVTGTDVNGCTGTATVPVTVNPLPSVSASSSASGVCNGGSVTLTASGANTYDWQPINSTSNPATDIPAAQTTYTVTGTDVNGCVNTSTVTVDVYSAPNISISGNSNSCPGDPVTLTASGANTYSWQPGGQTTTTITDNPSATTTYTATGTDVNGCSGTATFTVTVGTPPATPSITVNGGTMTSTVSGASYQWFLNGTPIAGATSQSYTPTQNGVYTVEVYDAAGCGSGQSAGITDPLGIASNNNVQFISVIPNPNNGQFTLNFTINDASDYVLEIHDVLGQVVYTESLNGFKGQYSKAFDLGMYGRGMYTIRLRSSANETTIKSITY